MARLLTYQVVVLVFTMLISIGASAASMSNQTFIDTKVEEAKNLEEDRSVALVDLDKHHVDRQLQSSRRVNLARRHTQQEKSRRGVTMTQKRTFLLAEIRSGRFTTRASRNNFPQNYHATWKFGFDAGATFRVFATFRYYITINLNRRRNLNIDIFISAGGRESRVYHYPTNKGRMNQWRQAPTFSVNIPGGRSEFRVRIRVNESLGLGERVDVGIRNFQMYKLQQLFSPVRPFP